MTDTLTRLRPNRARGDGSTTPPAPRRRVNVPWVVLGVLLVTGSGLAFVVLASHLSQRAAVLALAKPVAAGEVLTPAHLREARITTGAVATIPARNRSQVVGRAAITALRAGTLLSHDLLASGLAVRPGRAIVGIALDPGELPVTTLRAGDRVLVVRVPPGDATAPGDASEPLLAWPAQVFDVRQAERASGMTSLVSLEVADGNAPGIAAAAATKRVRLVLASPDSATDVDTALSYPATPTSPPARELR